MKNNVNLSSELSWHTYKYYPYEIELAKREVQALLPAAKSQKTKNGVRVEGRIDVRTAERLSYFASIKSGDRVHDTLQAKLERVNGGGRNRQSTRYSAHGLHEYKGKFNPQVVRAILNMFNMQSGSRVIDPFCGSGTSLLECAHLGMQAVGTDINPFAVFIANAKLKAARTPVQVIRSELKLVLQRCGKARVISSLDDARSEYLGGWFDGQTLRGIEHIRLAVEECAGESRETLLAIASNLLRDYSLQDPIDLRIRRRKTPLPEKPFRAAFEEAAHAFLDRLENAQAVHTYSADESEALLLDSRDLRKDVDGVGGKFDCALTSPPYATALPYIDTQRLSLVWLGLIAPSEILSLEARLVGSREVRGESKRELVERLMSNADGLPQRQARYCLSLQKALSDADGFRRQAVPILLYRYFASMLQVFQALRPLLKKGAPFALIVGGNHTTLGGKRFDIDTPQHLAELAQFSDWDHSETIPMQTYQRYGYHASNAVSTEGMVIVRAA
ncbi:hypothetical protein ASE10_05600 [Lysobacter sp. Root76]|nr:hypothetical protein ASE10_05600 [Lysobacter sp. Root76]KRD66683.1 hypothetical protein ASE45_15250 [Lysobacter sp. Root96]